MYHNALPAALILPFLESDAGHSSGSVGAAFSSSCAAGALRLPACRQQCVLHGRDEGQGDAIDDVG
ncbi:hypothetical protein, partial [Enterobacter hormaechei]|uniref:hypothetical protein n=1 Tax=Enterobacter hormaechei TaxID=158836 RepID=UPI00203C685F